MLGNRWREWVSTCPKWFQQTSPKSPTPCAVSVAHEESFRTTAIRLSKRSSFLCLLLHSWFRKSQVSLKHSQLRSQQPSLRVFIVGLQTQTPIYIHRYNNNIHTHFRTCKSIRTMRMNCQVATLDASNGLKEGHVAIFRTLLTGLHSLLWQAEVATSSNIRQLYYCNYNEN